MRVLIVTGSFPPDRCGVGDYTASLYRKLAVDPRVEVAVLTSARGPLQEPVADEPNVFRSMRSWRLDQAGALLRVVREWAPDIVHIQYPTQGYAGAALPWFVPHLARLSGAQVVQTWHEPYSRSSALRLLIQTTLRCAVVVVRPDYRDLLHRWLRWVFAGKRLRYIRSASTLPPCTANEVELDELRQRLLRGRRRLIVFFGFLYPHKRVELLFEVADPATDAIVIAGAIDPTDAYAARIAQLAATPPWNGHATLLGYLPAPEVTALLAAADAVVLPFQLGGGDWNTSIHAATQEQAFVLTTSNTAAGFDAGQNVYFARPDDVPDMKAALARHGGRRRGGSTARPDAWAWIANEHVELYGELLAARRRT